MKLASLDEGRDGSLVVVSRDLTSYVPAHHIAPHLQCVLDDWANLAPPLKELSDRLNAGLIDALKFNQAETAPPLPRAFQWCEGSCYLVHLERTRASTGRELPAALYREPGVWQGTSNYFVAPHAPIPVLDDNWDIDLEPSVAVITDDVPMGTQSKDAGRHIKLVVLLNDVSLRAIQIPEMSKGLGPVQGKPLKTFAPIAVTPEGLGDYWTGTMLARQVVVHVNGCSIGDPWAHIDYEFDFCQLIEYVARTRVIGAGSIISCGTVANRDEARGSTCLMERRAVEILKGGQALTPYLKFSDQIEIDCLDDNGLSIFGAMRHTVVKQRLL